MKKHVLHHEDHRFEFWMEGRGREAQVCCDAYVGTRDSDGVLRYSDKPVLE